MDLSGRLLMISSNLNNAKLTLTRKESLEFFTPLSSLWGSELENMMLMFEEKGVFATSDMKE